VARRRGGWRVGVAGGASASRVARRRRGWPAAGGPRPIRWCRPGSRRSSSVVRAGAGPERPLVRVVSWPRALSVCRPGRRRVSHVAAAPCREPDETRTRATVSSGSLAVRRTPLGEPDETRTQTTISSRSLPLAGPRPADRTKRAPRPPFRPARPARAIDDRPAGAPARSLAPMGRQTHHERQRSGPVRRRGISGTHRSPDAPRAPKIRAGARPRDLWHPWVARRTTDAKDPPGTHRRSPRPAAERTANPTLGLLTRAPFRPHQTRHHRPRAERAGPAPPAPGADHPPLTAAATRNAGPGTRADHRGREDRAWPRRTAPSPQPPPSPGEPPRPGPRPAPRSQPTRGTRRPRRSARPR